MNKTIETIPADAMSALCAYDRPGNIRARERDRTRGDPDERPGPPSAGRGIPPPHAGASANGRDVGCDGAGADLGGAPGGELGRAAPRGAAARHQAIDALLADAKLGILRAGE